MTTIASTLIENRAKLEKQVCLMTIPEIRLAIDEALAVIDMGILKGKDLENLKLGASILARILLRRQGK